MFKSKAALCLALGLMASGGVLADDDTSETVGLIEVPTDQSVEVTSSDEPKTDDGSNTEEERVLQTLFPTEMGGVESQSGAVESLNDFTGHPDLQELNQDEVLVLDNLATGGSKSLLKLKKASQ